MRGLWSVPVLALGLAAGACGDDGGPEKSATGVDASADSSVRDAAAAAGSGAPHSGGAGSGGRAGANAGGGAGSAGMGDAGGVERDAAAPAEEFVPLPDGSRETDEIVNLVDPEAAEELDEFLRGEPPVHVVLRQRLLHTVNLFLEHYEEAHDFLFVFTDHSITDTTTVGAFESLTRPAAPGGGSEIEIALGGYRTTGRLRAVIGVQWRMFVGPPLSHEIMHHWAVHLDPRLGFGKGRNVEYGPHWGFTAVHGQLGGFDGSTLKCETPAGSSPPGCTAAGAGRTRYVVGQFFPNSNPSVPYAPLELYLMGLLPAADVPVTFQALDRAELIPDSFDQTNRTVVVEAEGISSIAFADIVARHDEIEPLPEADRHFSAAFIVVSSEPASDEVMQDVAEWAAAFGNRGTSPVVTPFETLTGGRATLDTTLGARRTVSSAVPEPRERFECDRLEQDCPRPELACYGFSPTLCALSKKIAEGEPCDTPYACAAGLDCFSGPSAPTTYLCTPYCDPDDDGSTLACATLCPGMQQRFTDADDNTLGAICLN